MMDSMSKTATIKKVKARSNALVMRYTFKDGISRYKICHSLSLANALMFVLLFL